MKPTLEVGGALVAGIVLGLVAGPLHVMVLFCAFLAGESVYRRRQRGLAPVPVTSNDRR
jgi:hypothetical protein